MPGPKRYKTAKIGIILPSEDLLEKLSGEFAVFDKFYVKYELAGLPPHNNRQELENYASNAKKRGLEAVIISADFSDELPHFTAEKCQAPLIFAPVSKTNRSVPQKILASSSFCVTAANDFSKAAHFALKILALRDKSLSRRLLNLSLSKKERFAAEDSGEFPLAPDNAYYL
ncbi:MAG: AIR carboxylase family protein [Synergistaceae bacterium]|nr:AIR carboxylase family protein [Synergistaceae bacterium]